MVSNQYSEMFESLKSVITGALKQNDYEQCQSEINNLLRSLAGKHSSWQKLSNDLNMMRGKLSGEGMDMEVYEECIQQSRIINQMFVKMKYNLMPFVQPAGHDH